MSLNGTTFNCAGGASPWGTWITCQETPNGVDEQRSFLIGPGDPDDLNYEQKHGYLFEVPVSRGPAELEIAEPITSAGRFAHEAAAVDPATGAVYMTEDDFAYASGFFRYLLPNNPLEDKRSPGSTSSDGYGDGYGQVWMYDTGKQTLTLLFESPGPDVLDFPDNIIVSPRNKSVVLCEDSSAGNMLRVLTRDGLLFDFALNAVSGGVDEFAGATFSPHTQVLYTNMQANGFTFAIWGPWHRGLM